MIRHAAPVIDLAAERGRRTLSRSLDHLDAALALQRQKVGVLHATLRELDNEMARLGGLWTDLDQAATAIDIAPLRARAEDLARSFVIPT